MTYSEENSPIREYRRLLADGTLHHDPAQELAAEKLQLLHHTLKNYTPGKQSGWQSLIGLKKKPEPAPPGLYLYGDVGRGKSMIMDLFFDTAPFERKARVHFHAFMLDVHERINRFRREGRNKKEGDDPIPPVARDIARDTWLLCFDEFEVKDVADAMILGRLFSILFHEGVVVVATSNRVPNDLYKDGLNRQLFLPFIALLKQQMDVLHLQGAEDYRLSRLLGHPVYHAPAGAEADKELDDAFFSLTDSRKGESDEIIVKGRKLAIPEHKRGVARFEFTDLCARPLGPIDYLALSEHFHTLVVRNIPKLNPEKRNEARRLVTLIDVLYDNKVKLICSAEVGPNELYPEGDGTFEFARTVSRLMEMQSEDYVTAPHRAVV